MKTKLKSIVAYALAFAFTLLTGSTWAVDAPTPVDVWDGDFSTLTGSSYYIEVCGNEKASDNSYIKVTKTGDEGDNPNGIHVNHNNNGGESTAATVIFKVTDLPTGKRFLISSHNHLSGGGGNNDPDGVYIDENNKTHRIGGGNPANGANPSESLTANLTVRTLAYVWTTNGVKLYEKTSLGVTQVYGGNSQNSSFRFGGCTIGAEKAKCAQGVIPATTGMKLNAVALFESALSDEQIAAYQFPSDSDDPTPEINIAMSGETVKVSDINGHADLSEAADKAIVNLTLTGTSTLNLDAAFKCSKCNVTLEGPLTIAGDLSRLGKFNLAGVTGDLSFTLDGDASLNLTRSGAVNFNGAGTVTLTGSSKFADTMSIAKTATVQVNHDYLNAVNGTTVSGTGTLVFNGGGNSNTDIVNIIKCSFANDWTGTVELNNYKGGCDRAAWVSQSPNGIFRYVNCYGWWRPTANTRSVLSGKTGYEASVEFKDVNNTIALEVANGWSGTGSDVAVIFKEFLGDGTFKYSWGNSYPLIVRDLSKFEGTINLTNTAGSPLYVSDSADYTIFNAADKGKIVICSGNEVKIPSGKTWSAVNGTVVNGTLSGLGKLTGNTTFGEGGTFVASTAGVLTIEGNLAGTPTIDGAAIAAAGVSDKTVLTVTGTKANCKLVNADGYLLSWEGNNLMVVEASAVVDAEFDAAGASAKVSDINGLDALKTATAESIVNLTLKNTTTLEFDQGFVCKVCSITLDGDLTLVADGEPADFDKFDFSGVSGRVLHGWYYFHGKKVIAVNFNARAVNNNDGGGNDANKLGNDEDAGLPEADFFPGKAWLQVETRSQDSWEDAAIFDLATSAVVDGATPQVKWSSANNYMWTDPSCKLLRGYLDDGGSHAQVSMTGIPFDAYDVMILFATDSGNYKFSPVSVNDTKYTFKNGQTAVAASDADTWGQSHALTAEIGTNALLIKKCTGDLAIVGGANANTARGGIAAVVIVEAQATFKDIDCGAAYTLGEADNAYTEDFVNLNFGEEGGVLTLGVAPTRNFNIKSKGVVSIVFGSGVAGSSDLSKLNATGVEGGLKFTFTDGTVPAVAPAANVIYRWEGETALATIPFADVAHAGTIELACPVTAVDGTDQDASMNGAKGLVVFDNGFSLTTAERVSLGGASGSNQSYVQNGGKFELTSDAVPGGCGVTPIVLARWPVTVNYDLKAGQLLAENGTVQNWDGSFNLTVGDAEGTEPAIFKAKGFAINRTPTSNFTILKNGTFAIGANGINTGANQFFKLNGGTLDAYAPINYTFGSSIQAMSASTINVADGATLTVTGALTGEGVFTKTGNGMLKVSGDTTDFAGSIDFTSGGLTIAPGVAVTVADGQTLSIVVTDEQKAFGYEAEEVTLVGDGSLVAFLDANGGVIQEAAHTTTLAPQALTWEGDESGSWDVAGNWSGNRVPTANDVVIFDTEATVTLSASSEAKLVEVGVAGVAFSGTTASRKIKCVEIAEDAELTVDNAGDFYLSDVIGGKITKTGAGTLFFVNENDSALDDTTVEIQNGKVELNNDNNDAITTNPTFIIGENGTLDNFGWITINGMLTVTTDFNKAIFTNRGSNNANCRGGTSFIKNGKGAVTLQCGATGTNFGSVEVNGGVLDLPKVTALTDAITGSGICGVYYLPTGTTQSSLQNSDNWTGTIWIKNISSTPAGGLKFNTYGNANSTVRLTNVKGWQANDYNQGAVELVDGDNGELAFEVTDSSQNRGYTYTKLTGTGTLKFATKASSACAMYIEDVSEFKGKLLSTAGLHENGTNVTSPRPIYVGTTTGDKTTTSLISVADGATINSGCGWEAANVAFGSTVTIKGAVGDTVVSGIGTEPTALPEVTLKNAQGETVEGYYALKYGEGKLTVVVRTVDVTIPEIANTTVAVTGGTLVGTTATVPYGAALTVTYTLEADYIFSDGTTAAKAFEFENVTEAPEIDVSGIKTVKVSPVTPTTGDVKIYADETGKELVLAATGDGYTGDDVRLSQSIANYTEVKSVVIGAGVKHIGNRYFKDFTGLTTVKGGKDLVKFDEKAFYRCMSLEKIELENPEALESLKDAVVYQMAINEEGEFFMIPSIQVSGYTENLWGKKTLDTKLDDWEKIDELNKLNLETLKQEGVYHFFQTRLEKDN